MIKQKVALGLLLGGLAMTTSFEASAINCWYTPTASWVDHTYMHHSHKWFKQNPSSGDVGLSTYGSITNSSTTTTAQMVMPLYGSYPPAGNPGQLLFAGTPLAYLWVVVMLNDINSPAATCTARAYSALHHAFTVSGSHTSSCGLEVVLDTQGEDVMAHIRCDLPPKVSGLPASEILTTGEYLTFYPF